MRPSLSTGQRRSPLDSLQTMTVQTGDPVDMVSASGQVREMIRSFRGVLLTTDDMVTGARPVKWLNRIEVKKVE